jgi:acyl carrier protein
VKERVYQTVSRIFGVPVGELNEQSSVETIESWDSLKHMNLMLALEEEFGVSFTDDEIMSMISVERILNALNGRGG